MEPRAVTGYYHRNRDNRMAQGTCEDPHIATLALTRLTNQGAGSRITGSSKNFDTLHISTSHPATAENDFSQLSYDSKQIFSIDRVLPPILDKMKRTSSKTVTKMSDVPDLSKYLTFY